MLTREKMSVETLQFLIDAHPWQKRAFEDWRLNGRRGIIDAVTGAGKTAIGLIAIYNVRYRFPGARAVVLVPTDELMEQWCRELKSKLAIEPDAIGRLGGGYNDDLDRHEVLVAVVDSARSKIGPIVARHPGPGVLLVADECHRYGSPENARALEAEYTWTLGLSATPERFGDAGFETVLAPRLGGPVHRYNYAQALAEAVIAPFEILYVGVRPPEPNGGVDAKPAVIRQLAPALRSRKTILFHERVEELQAFSELLGAACIPHAIHHGELDPAARQDVLEHFKCGRIRTLLSCRTLEEGIDVPDADLAIIAAGTSSLRQKRQRLGRVLRRADGKQLAQIVILYHEGRRDDVSVNPYELDFVQEMERVVGVDFFRWPGDGDVLVQLLTEERPYIVPTELEQQRRHPILVRLVMAILADGVPRMARDLRREINLRYPVTITKSRLNTALHRYVREGRVVRRDDHHYAMPTVEPFSV